MNAVNGGYIVFIGFSVSLSVGMTANTNDVITSPTDCILSVTSLAATLAVVIALKKEF